MKKYLPTLINSFLLIFFGFLLIPGIVAAKEDILTLPWTTTFSGAPIDMSGSFCHSNNFYNPGHGGIVLGVCGDANRNVGAKASANYPGGGGGNGLYWQVGDGNTTRETGPTGSGMLLDFPDSPEVWIRWYFRFENGMPVNHNSGFSQHKLLYIIGANAAKTAFLDDQGSGFSLFDRSKRWTGTYSFRNFYGGGFSDGTWHAVEFYFNTDTGQFSYWVYPNGVDNPTPNYSTSAVNYRFAIIDNFRFPSNVKTDFTAANNGRVFEVYYDDIAISTKGRIGALNVSTNISSENSSSGGCFVTTAFHKRK